MGKSRGGSRISFDMEILRRKFINKPEINDIDDIHRIYAPVLYLSGNANRNEKLREHYQSLYDFFQIKKDLKKERSGKGSKSKRNRIFKTMHQKMGTSSSNNFRTTGLGGTTALGGQISKYKLNKMHLN